MKNKHLCYLSLLLFFNLFLLAKIHAQVELEFPEAFTDTIDKNTLARVEVTNLTGVDIDYLFKAWMVGDSGQTLLSLESSLLQQKTGIANFKEESEGSSRLLNRAPWTGLKTTQQKKGWQVYTGNVFITARLVHPLDTSSVIAETSKAAYLIKGVFSKADGSPVTDPHKFSLSFWPENAEWFKIEDFFSYFEIHNYNPIKDCLPLQFEVIQEFEVLFRASIQSICIPSGHHRLSKLNPLIEISLNHYVQRSPDKPIEIQYQLGIHSPSNISIPPQIHSPKHD